MTEIVSRRHIVRGCKGRGWMVQPAALAAMHSYLNRQQDEDSLLTVLNEMESRLDKGTKFITEETWKKIMEENDAISAVKDDNCRNTFKIINAFEIPRLSYDSMRKTFRVEEKKWPLLGTAADKIDMLSQRYALTLQRVLRHDIFRKVTKTYYSSQSDSLMTQQHTLTAVESLLGKSNSDQNLVLVLGILTQVEEGKFYLEDPSGQVQVSFASAKVMDSFFVTEHSILLVEARFQDEILFVDKIGPPFIEERYKSLQMLQQQVRHEHFLPTSVASLNEKDPTYVVLSDVHLDQPRVLTLLVNLFDSYESFRPSDLPVFCLMGNFHSGQHITGSMDEYWSELATTIARFQNIAEHAHFVFIPGPRDSRSGLLPQSPLNQEVVGLNKIMQSRQIMNVEWASNPCRIRQNGKEIVLFRYDTLSWMLQNQIRLDLLDDATDRTPHSRMIKTILDQGHLLPVPRAPIYWNYDHALRLYPIPDALIFGSSSESEDWEIYENCDAINPGSFASKGIYAVFSPGQSEDDMSVDSQDEKASFRVLFNQVKEAEG